MTTGIATIKNGMPKVFIENYNDITGGLRVSTSRLLDVFTMVLTKQNHYSGKTTSINPEVSISVEDYMKLCGIPDAKASKDKTICKVKEDLEALYRTSIEWSENSGKKQRNFAKMRICDKVSISNGNIIFCFSAPLAQYLTNAYIMQHADQTARLEKKTAAEKSRKKTVKNKKSERNNNI